MNETQKRRRPNHADRILEALRSAGPKGCLNTELWTICHAVNSRISDLRQRGFNIEGKWESASEYRYTLREDKPAVEVLLGQEEALPF